MSRVITIPARSIVPFTPDGEVKRIRVAGYARVSTDDEEQLSSYSAQLDYYEKKIKSNPEWEFAGMYADEGISGTNTKKRDGFNLMVEDALSGKIDRIITKSVSRFARNTVDSLTTIRKLKEKGVGIYFEKENIDTLDAKGELLITIMSSLAQEESRSISENVTWGNRKKMADGKFSLAYKHFLGYDKGEDDKLVINEEQATIVKLIYQLFLSGKTCTQICRELERRGINTTYNKNRWHPSTIQSILTNEKYKGDALLQKYYTPNFLEKKLVKNDGKVQQYYVKGCHEAIIDPETFDLVQAEIARRRNSTKQYSGKNMFSSKVKCNCCGDYYGPKVWHSNDKYRKIMYRCNSKYINNCTTPTLSEETLKQVVVKALEQAFDLKEEVQEDIRFMLDSLDNTASLELEREADARELDKIIKEMDDLNEGNSCRMINHDDYSKKYTELANEYERISVNIDCLDKRINDSIIRKQALKDFCEILNRDSTGEFDEALLHTMVDSILVISKNEFRVMLKVGKEITV